MGSMPQMSSGCQPAESSPYTFSLTLPRWWMRHQLSPCEGESQRGGKPDTLAPLSGKGQRCCTRIERSRGATKSVWTTQPMGRVAHIADLPSVTSGVAGLALEACGRPGFLRAVLLRRKMDGRRGALVLPGGRWRSPVWAARDRHLLHRVLGGLAWRV